MHTKSYPLKFRPIYRPKVWGGRTLEHLGRTLPGDASNPIGEAWEVADLPVTGTPGATSGGVSGGASGGGGGGGGGSARSVVANGPLAGRTLHDLIAEQGDAWMGRLQLTPAGDFPLLVKYLDARQNLSVQVHPSPAYARAHPDAHLKSEAWYVLAADPGAVIYKGVRDGVTPDDFRAAIASGDESAVTDLLNTVPARRGECHYLPSGTCHALGAGILVAEAQTPSDTTFRVYDWGRPRKSEHDRQLHIEQAMQCIHFGPPHVAPYEQRTHIAGIHTTVSRLCLCEHFRIERVRMGEQYEQELPYDQPAIWMVLEGEGSVDPGSEPGPVTFRGGDTLLMPAGMQDPRVKIEKDTVWLEITFPQATPEEIL